MSTTLRPILLATDDSNDVYAFWGYHKQCGVHNRVEVVSDGEDALRYLESTMLNYPLPALLIISLKMPRINGLKVLEQIAENYPNLHKVLMIDEKDHDVALIGAAYKLGVEAFLMRPLLKNEFCSLMSRFGDSLTMDGCPQSDTLTQPAMRTNPESPKDDAPSEPPNRSLLTQRPRVFPANHLSNADITVGAALRRPRNCSNGRCC